MAAARQAKLLDPDLGLEVSRDLNADFIPPDRPRFGAESRRRRKKRSKKKKQVRDELLEAEEEPAESDLLAGCRAFAEHCTSGDLDALKEALERQPSPSQLAHGLVSVSLRGNAIPLDLLLAAGADPDAESATVPGEPDLGALALAVRSGSLHCVRSLVDAGADLERACSRRLTPLLHAIEVGALDAAAELLEAGCDPSARDVDGWTPLMHAASAGDAPLARLLLDHGADAGVENDAGHTALQLATRRRKLTVVDLLSSPEALSASPRPARTRRRSPSPSPCPSPSPGPSPGLSPSPSPGPSPGPGSADEAAQAKL